MRKTKNLLSVFFSFVMLFTIISAMPANAQAAALPKTSVSGITSYPCGFNVYIKSQKNINGYQIQYSTRSDFKNAKSAKSSKTSFVVRNRASATKYYVRVRTYKTFGKKTSYSAWSASKTITTLHKYASDPAHIKSITAQHCGFKVNTYNSSNAAGYQVRYSTNSNMSGAKTDTVQGKNSTTLTVSGRAGKKKYYIQTRTYKTVNGKKYYSYWSPTKSITTQAHNYKTPVYATKKVKIDDAWDEPVYETRKVKIKDAWDEPVFRKDQSYYCSGCYKNMVTEYHLGGYKEMGISFSNFEIYHQGDACIYSETDNIIYNDDGTIRSYSIRDKNGNLYGYRWNADKHKCTADCDRVVEKYSDGSWVAWDTSEDGSLYLHHIDWLCATRIPVCDNHTGRLIYGAYVSGRDISGTAIGKANFVKVPTGEVIHHDAVYQSQKIQIGTKHHNAVYENKKVVTGYKCACGQVKKSTVQNKHIHHWVDIYGKQKIYNEEQIWVCGGCRTCINEQVDDPMKIFNWFCAHEDGCTQEVHKKDPTQYAWMSNCNWGETYWGEIYWDSNQNTYKRLVGTKQIKTGQKCATCGATKSA